MALSTFQLMKVDQEVKNLVDKMVREKHIEIEPGGRDKVEKRLARIVKQYIVEYDELDTEAYKFLADHDMDTDYYKRVMYNLAKDKDFPMGSEALDQMNKDFEAALWDEDSVVDLFVDSRELVAIVTPHLKAMRK